MITPEQRKLHRYGFLTAYSLRNDEEQAEMERLEVELREEGIVPGWEPVPRCNPDEIDMTPFQRAPSRGKK